MPQSLRLVCSVVSICMMYCPTECVLLEDLVSRLLLFFAGCTRRVLLWDIAEGRESNGLTRP